MYRCADGRPRMTVREEMMANQTAAWPPGARTAVNSVGAPSHREYARVALASAIGTTVEYYDFTVYATVTALVFNKIFFPSGDPLVGSLAAFATFFVGYCARPLGGILFGHFGDRLGRRNMLILTVLIMGLGTFLIGLMPTYAQVGLWAPILLPSVPGIHGIGLVVQSGGS